VIVDNLIVKQTIFLLLLYSIFCLIILLKISNDKVFSWEKCKTPYAGDLSLLYTREWLSSRPFHMFFNVKYHPFTIMRQFNYNDNDAGDPVG